MKKYEIIGRYIKLFDGKVYLTEDQAKRRGASVSALGGGLYQIVTSVQFKVGEIIGIDYEPPKGLVEFMRALEEPKKPKKPEEPEEPKK